MTAKVRKALEDEATNNEVEFEHNGKKYTCSTKLSVRALNALENNKATKCLEAMLGAKQFEQYLSEDPDIDDLNEMVKVLFDSLGIDEGESGD